MKYVAPKYEKLENPESKGQFFVRLAYGVVGSYMDTKQMTTREVIEEFLRKNGVKTPREFFEKKFKGGKEPDTAKGKGGQGNEINDKPLERESFDDALKRMVNDTKRIGFARVITKKKITENIKLGQNGVGEMTAHLFNEDSFGMETSKGGKAFYSPSNNYCAWRTEKFTDADSTYHERGETFYHEIWHAIDNNYGESTYIDRYGFPDDSTCLSSSHRLSTGKTFVDTLISEYTLDKVAEMQKEIQKDIDDYCPAKYGMTKEQIAAKYDEILKKGAEIRTGEGIMAYIDFTQTKEYKETLEMYRDSTKKYPNSVKKKWASLSDVVSGATNGKETLCGVGHFDYGYWTKENRGTELFAEIAGAKATNKANYDTIKKYFPETVKAFEEIYSGLQSGKIKSRGRPKYEH